MSTGSGRKGTGEEFCPGFESDSITSPQELRLFLTRSDDWTGRQCNVIYGCMDDGSYKLITKSFRSDAIK